MKTKVTINRAEWRCGGTDDITNYPNRKGEGATNLLNSEGFMCCMGIASLAMGITRGLISGVAVPEEVECKYPLNEYTHSDWVTGAVYYNDYDAYSPEIREAVLLAHCKREDSPVEFEFVGEYIN